MKRLALFALMAGVLAGCDAEDGRNELTQVGPISLDAFAVSDFFTPSGFMGDGQNPGYVTMHASRDCAPRDPSAAGRCYRFDYGPPGSAFWAGVFWSFPANNWGSEEGRAFRPWIHDTTLGGQQYGVGTPESLRVLRQRYNRVRFRASARRDSYDINFRSWVTADGQNCAPIRAAGDMTTPCTCNTLLNAGVRVTSTTTGQVATAQMTISAEANAGTQNIGTGLVVAPQFTNGYVGGNYALRCTAAAANGGVFTLEDPMQMPLQADITLPGTPGGSVLVNAGPFTFTLMDGDVDFAVGDTFTLAEAIYVTDGRVSPETGAPVYTKVTAPSSNTCKAVGKLVLHPDNYNLEVFQPEGIPGMMIRSWDGTGTEIANRVDEGALVPAPANFNVYENATSPASVSISAMSGRAVPFTSQNPPLDVIFFAGGVKNGALEAQQCSDEGRPCNYVDNALTGATPRQLVTRVSREGQLFTLPTPAAQITSVNPVTRSENLLITIKPCVKNAAGESPIADDTTASVLCPAGTIDINPSNGRAYVATCEVGLRGQMDALGNIVCCVESAPMVNATTGALDCGTKDEFVTNPATGVDELMSTPKPVFQGFWSPVDELSSTIIGGFGWSVGYTEFEAPPGADGANTMMPSFPPDQVPKTYIFIDDVVWDYAVAP